MRRRSSHLIVAGAAVLALAACSGGSDDPDTDDPQTTAEESTGPSDLTGSLQIWTDGTKQPAVEEIVERFQEDYPGVDVDLVEKNFGDIGPDFITQVPTGEGPDIIVTPHDSLGNLQRAGVIAPVELGDLADQLNPTAVEAFTLDGQTYGMPYAVENIGLVRNNELTEDEPQTWDDLVSSAEAAGTEFGLVLNVTEDGNPYNFYPLQTAFGSSVFARDDDGSYVPDLTLGDEHGVEFAQWLATQGPAADGPLDPAMTADVGKQAFLDGDAPYFVTGPWDGADFRDADMDVSVLPIPSPGPEPAGPFLGVQGFVISAESENQLLANEFLTGYVGSAEGQLDLFRYGPGTPALTEAAESPEVTDDPLNAGFAAAGEAGVPMPSIPEVAHTWVLWGRAEVEILKGGDPEETWTQMAQNVQDEIDAGE